MSASDGLYGSNVVAEVKELNPYGNVDSVDTTSIKDAVLEGHTLVVAYCADLEELRELSARCEAAKISLIGACQFGFKACCFLQLHSPTGPHTFKKEIGKDKLSDPVSVEYPPLSAILDTKDWTTLKDRWGPVRHELVAWNLVTGFDVKGSDLASFKEHATSKLASLDLASSFTGPELEVREEIRRDSKRCQ